MATSHLLWLVRQVLLLRVWKKGAGLCSGGCAGEEVEDGGGKGAVGRVGSQLLLH